MRPTLVSALVTSLGFVYTTTALLRDTEHILGPQGVNLWRLKETHSAQTGFKVQETTDQLSWRYEEFPPQWFTQPLDHFEDSPHTFGQRYWVNARHYKPRPGVPVIVLDGGETTGEDRLPFLDTGIVNILAKATGGLGVVLEHRYYGNESSRCFKQSSQFAITSKANRFRFPISPQIHCGTNI
jgi:hypothetical protein